MFIEICVYIKYILQYLLYNRHAKVTWDITSDGRLAVRIKDTKSTNGTKINGARIDSQR